MPGEAGRAQGARHKGLLERKVLTVRHLAGLVAEAKVEKVKNSTGLSSRMAAGSGLGKS